MKYYRGTKYIQTGDGFPILLSNLFRRALPLLTQHVLPFLGKKLIQRGSETFDQLKQGVPLKQAVKRSFQRTRDEIFGKRKNGYKKAMGESDYFTHL
jgi:hypothetical protein